MLYGRNRPRNNVSDIIRGYQERRCLNQYSKIKGEIEHQIAELTKNYNSLFCKKCGAIKKDIFKKKTELNFCYNNNYLKPKLLEDIVINDFIKNCADPPHCRNPTAVPKRTVALEKSKDVPCKKGITGCNKSTAQPKTEEGKSKPRADAETSEIIGLKGPASVKQGQEHHHVGKSRSEISQDKPGTTAPHSPVGTHDEAPQQLDNKHNTPSGEGATQLEGLSHEPPSTDSKLGEPSSDSSHQHNSQRVSDVNCTPQGTISDQKCTERNASSIKDLDAHLQGEQSAADRIAKRQDGLQDVTTSENPDDRSTSGQIGGDEKSSVVGAPGGVDDDKAPVTLPVSNECPNPGTTCENGGSKHSVDQISNNEALAENTSYPHTASVSTGAGNDSEDATNTVHLQESVDKEKQRERETTHTQAVSYKSDKPTDNPHLHQSDSSFILTYLPSPSGQKLLEPNQENHGGALGRGSSAAAGMAEETVKYENDNGLGILSQFFNNIPHKDYMMMGFIPMYTPLRAIFSKKKKKRRNDMNEKLQRVLQQTSIESEQKRIPFSYSAFEYSS